VDNRDVGVLDIDMPRGADGNSTSLHNAAVVEVGFAVGIRTGCLRLARATELNVLGSYISFAVKR
jgi:hypothetical protein